MYNPCPFNALSVCSKPLNRIGEKHISREGYSIEIIEYKSHKNCTVKIDNKIILNNLRYDHIKNGEVRNPYHKSVYGVGYLGEGVFKPLFLNKKTKAYSTWSSMLERCYSKKSQVKNPSYKSVLVSDEWHNFQVFAKWFEENYMEGLCLDKDILVKGNKTYSPETCAFVPKEINSLFTKSTKTRGDLPIGIKLYMNGKFRSCMNRNNKTTHLGYFNTLEEAFYAYKTAKEGHIKEVADKWKGKITDQVYQAMYNYKVEIND